MAFTINVTTIGPTAKRGGKTPWVVDAVLSTSGIQVLRAAPSSGAQYIENIVTAGAEMITSDAFTIYNSSVIAIGPIHANRGDWKKNYNYPLKMSNAIAVNITTAKNFHIVIEGYDTEQ